jgi:hypothetical protein
VRSIESWGPIGRRRREELAKVASLLGEAVMSVSSMELLLVEFWHELRLHVPEPQRNQADKHRQGQPLATRVRDHLPPGVPAGLRAAITAFCEECLAAMERRNRYVHDPWHWAIPPDREHEEDAWPTHLQMRLDVRQGDHPPWTEEQQPRWRVSDLHELQVFRDDVEELRDDARDLLLALQENLPPLDE